MNSTSKPVVIIVGCEAVTHDDAAPFAHRWFLVDVHDSACTEAYKDQLHAVKVRISQGNLVLRAPGMLRIDIPMDVIEDDDSVCREIHLGEQSIKVVDEGDLAAVWFGNVVGEPCRLVKVHPDVATPSF